VALCICETKLKCMAVTPRVSKPHDYANHMFMRLSVDQIRNLESNFEVCNFWSSVDH
jgi:hypothetical protein